MTRAIEVGDKLPEWSLPITPTMVISTAIATRDFQDVHHDRDRAQAAGSKDVFVNILTSTALCERYVTAWAGDDVQIVGIGIRLGAPAYPYDTFTFTGEVTEIGVDETGRRVATIKVTGAVSLGSHVIGTVKVAA